MSVTKVPNGTKTVGVVVAGGALMWMLWQAQQSNIAAQAKSIGSLERLINQRLNSLERQVTDHTTLASHAIQQQDGIRALEGRVDRLEAWRETWIQTVPALDAKQNEQLRSLERVIFPHGIPADPIQRRRSR